MDTAAAVTFAVVWAFLSTGHALADHVLGQTDKQAAHKAAPSKEDRAAPKAVLLEEGGGAPPDADPYAGWGACLAHVLQYHIVLLMFLSLGWQVFSLDLTPAGVLTGFGISAASHAFLDRRWPVKWILENTRSPDFARMKDHGMNGMYLADQALHKTFLLGASLAITLV